MKVSHSLDPHAYHASIIVAGTRKYANVREFESYLEDYLSLFSCKALLISGAAHSGADRMVIEYGQRRDIPVLEVPANWDRDGRAAGYIRNDVMAKLATHLLVFWDGKSKGTDHMIRSAAKRNLHTTVIIVDIPPK